MRTNEHRSEQDQWDALARSSWHLHNLLARIHRDGGHYTEEHGLEKSVADAHKIVASLVVK